MFDDLHVLIRNNNFIYIKGSLVPVSNLLLPKDVIIIHFLLLVVAFYILFHETNGFE